MRRLSPRGLPGLAALAGAVALCAVVSLLVAPTETAAAERPSVRITLPAPAAKVVSGRVPVRVSARSTNGIRRVEFRVDGRRRWVQRRPPWRFGGRRGAWDTRRYKRGVRRLAVVAVDRRGRATAVRRRVRVVRAARRPYVAITRPRAGATLTGPVVLTAQAVADRGIRRVEFRIDGKRRWTQRRAPWRFGGKRGRWDTSKYPTGRRRISVTAIDKRGRRTTRTRWVTITRPGDAPSPARATTGTELPGHPPTPPARVLPPPTRFVATTGSDSSPTCAAAAPCKSFNRAYRVASPGEVVEVAGGSYPYQTFEADPSKTSDSDVHFRPAPGATVAAEYIKVYGAHIELRSISTSGWYIYPGASDVTFRDVRSSGSGSFITSANDVALIGGSITDVDSLDGLQVKMAGSGYPEPTNLIIDGLVIDRITRNGDPAAHTECIQFTAGRNVTIRNSRFVNCSTQGVFFKEGLGGEIDDVLVENSWFGKITGINTLIFDDGVSNMTARYNSFAQSPRLGDGIGASNVVAYGNVGVNAGCGSGVAYRHNVWSKDRCGATDVVASPGFLDMNGFDLRLAPGSAAIDRGDPAVYPSYDMFGTIRPEGGRADAGAQEAR